MAVAGRVALLLLPQLTTGSRRLEPAAAAAACLLPNIKKLATPQKLKTILFQEYFSWDILASFSPIWQYKSFQPKADTSYLVFATETKCCATNRNWRCPLHPWCTVTRGQTARFNTFPAVLKDKAQIFFNGLYLIFDQSYNRNLFPIILLLLNHTSATNTHICLEHTRLLKLRICALNLPLVFWISNWASEQMCWWLNL